MIDLLYIVNSISIKNMGVSIAISNLFTAISRNKNFDLEIVATEDDKTIFKENSSRIHIFSSHSPWWYSPGLANYLKNRRYAPGALMHIHGVWLYPQYSAAKIAQVRNLPYIITPHGMLSHWHLRRKWWKLMPYLRIMEERNLKKADCIHAITIQEKEYLKKLIPSLKRIEVIPNGIDPDSLSGQPEISSLVARYPFIKDRPIVLFMGRLHPNKSVQELVEAWIEVTNKNKEYILMIVGPDQVNLKAQLMKKIKQAKIENRIVFTGLLLEGLRLAAFRLAKIFINPSKTEAIGFVNLEAAWMGIPLLVTRETGLLDIENLGAGRFTLPTLKSIASNLYKMMKLPDSELKEMGRNARKMIEERYLLEKTSKQLIELYKSIIKL
jgi:glycosyltransferase involved in cell wall biosynthesis